MLPCSLKELALPAGWATHYSIGIAWATVYEYLWQKSALKPTITSGIALGGVSGLTAVVAWKLFFIQIHPVSILKDFMRIWCWRM